MKRGASNLNFLISVDKPSGITSHDLVNQYRKKYGEGRIGHMGTLDPLASGMMILGVGQAARLNQFIEAQDKTYEVTASFGRATNTYDAEGETTQEVCVPDDFDFDVKLLLGKQKQTPPAFSAVKINGVPSYVSARKGKSVSLPEREIEVYDAKILGRKSNDFKIELRVSKGTYIRSLIHDLGQKLHVPAYVKELRRTKIGDICEFEKLNAAKVLGFPIIELDDICDVLNGKSVNTPQIDQFVSIIHKDKLYAVYKDNKAVCVFNQGIDL